MARLNLPTGWQAQLASLTDWFYLANNDPEADSYDVNALAYQVPPYVVRLFTDSNPIPKAGYPDGFGFSSGFEAMSAPMLGILGNGEQFLLDPEIPLTPGASHLIPEHSMLIMVLLLGGLLRSVRAHQYAILGFQCLRMSTMSWPRPLGSQPVHLVIPSVLVRQASESHK